MITVGVRRNPAALTLLACGPGLLLAWWAIIHGHVHVGWGEPFMVAYMAYVAAVPFGAFALLAMIDVTQLVRHATMLPALPSRLTCILVSLLSGIAQMSNVIGRLFVRGGPVALFAPRQWAAAHFGAAFDSGDLIALLAMTGVTLILTLQARQLAAKWRAQRPRVRASSIFAVCLSIVVAFVGIAAAWAGDDDPIPRFQAKSGTNLTVPEHYVPADAGNLHR